MDKESVKSTAAKIEEKVHAADEVVAQGKGWSDHPIHPSTVHWPLAFLTAGFGLDVLHRLVPPATSSSFIATFLPPRAQLPVFAHYATAAGILTALPSLVTGSSEVYDMMRGQILQKGLKKTLLDAYNKVDIPGEKLRIAIIHGVSNDAIVLLAAVNWWLRRGDASAVLPQTNWVLSAIALPALMYSAYLGGDMVYRLGVGVQRQGQGAEIKKKQMEGKSS